MISIVKNAVWTAWSVAAKRAARAYVAGVTIEDAVRVCCWLSEQSLASTIAFWDGEEDTPFEVTTRYLTVLDKIASEKLDSYASIKAPSIQYDWELLERILERSLESNVAVHFDSLGPETADKTFALLQRARSYQGKLGCTLPSRWARSIDDVERAADLQLRVRVVKGQWEDPVSPDVDVRASYLSIVDRLAGRVPCVAVATHDIPLACECLKRLRTTDTRSEFELLFGLPLRPAIRLAREMTVPVRLYVPYGEAYLPYTLSQARKRPSTFWWIIRDTLLSRTLVVPRSYRR